MNKLFIVLCLASSVSFQAPAISISAKLSGNQTNQPKAADKAGKVIVACACDDLFPTVQALLVQSKSDVKDIVKLQLNTMGLNKVQLNSVKLMVKDAEPLMLEGARVCAALIKKYGKGAVSIYKKTAAQMLIAGDGSDVLENSADQEALEAIFDLVVDDAQFNQFMEKVAAFNEKWAESFALIMEASAAAGAPSGVTQDPNLNALRVQKRVQKMQESIQKVLVAAMSNKRAMGIQSLIVPIVSTVKTQADLIQVVQACLNELETKLPHLVASTERFAEFGVPFLATVITESVDETLQSMSA